MTDSGSFGNWDPSDLFNVGNEASSERPWLGTIRLVAVYDRPLSAAEVVQNFGVGPTGAAP